MMLSLALTVGLTLALAGMANAASMGTCGGCHGTTATSNPLPNDSDNCKNTAHGLHGTHANYSSAYYTGKRNAVSPTNYAKCAYCHVNTTVKASSLTHNNNYINVTGVDNGGKATNLTYNFGAKTCASACHKNPGSAAPKWGNYTASVVGGIKLDCNSCHDDTTAGGRFATGPGKHNKHILSNVTTPSGTLMSATLNAGCVNCHPNETTDLWSGGKGSDNGSLHAYPHATDGTNVVSDKVILQGQITGSSKAGTSTTCATNACHSRVTVTWGQAVDCNMCHYYAAVPLDTDNIGTGSLSTGHNAHIKLTHQFVCTTCHPSAGYVDGAHASSVPAHTWNAKVVKAGMTYSLPGKTCSGSGTGCHGVTNPSPAWGTTTSGCSACHNYPGSASDWIAGNGHAVKYAAGTATNTHLRDNGSYDKLLDNALGVANIEADVNKCGRCHYNQSATHNNGTINTAASPGAGETCSGGNFTITIVTPGANVTCANVLCHSGKTTINWY